MFLSRWQQFNPVCRIEAGCKNGVLILRLPRAEAAQPKQIKVTG